MQKASGPKGTLRSQHYEDSSPLSGLGMTQWVSQSQPKARPLLSFRLPTCACLSWRSGQGARCRQAAGQGAATRGGCEESPRRGPLASRPKRNPLSPKGPLRSNQEDSQKDTSGVCTDILEVSPDLVILRTPRRGERRILGAFPDRLTAEVKAPEPESSIAFATL